MNPMSRPLVAWTFLTCSEGNARDQANAYRLHRQFPTPPMWIATFTGDLSQAMAGLSEHIRPSIIAITDDQQSYAYPAEVIFEIREAEADDYVTAARILNEGQFDVVSLQHEFGIFGGPDGELILKLLEHLRIPIVTTCHTILADPTPSQRRVLQKVAACSSRIVVMAEKGRALLTEIYGVAARKSMLFPMVFPTGPFTIRKRPRQHGVMLAGR